MFPDPPPPPPPPGVSPPPVPLTLTETVSDAGSEFEGVAVKVTVYVPAVEAVTVQVDEELLSTAMDDIVEQPDDIVIPVPETLRTKEFAVVPPVFCTFRFAV